VAGARTVLAATAANRSQLAAAMQSLPDVLTQAQRTLAQLAGVSNNALPMLRDLRPTTDSLVGISTEISRLADAADPALAGLEPVLRHGLQLVNAARPVIGQLASAAPAAQQTVSALSQVGLGLVGNDEKLSNLLDFIKFWALTTNGQDGLSHYFRAHVVAETEIATSPIRTPPTSSPNKKGVPGVPLAKTLGSLHATVNTVTGLTSQQEHSLLSQLLGGSS
jgi:phospholipid/cholesterol/gamma-HCH transport system substrate-binding protein